ARLPPPRRPRGTARHRQRAELPHARSRVVTRQESGVRGPYRVPSTEYQVPGTELYPFASHFLDLDGVRLHYLDEGAGDPVVMVHGNPTWSFYFRDLVRTLRNTHRVVVPDHVGCGLSDKPDDSRYEYKLRRRVDDVERLLDHLGLRENLTLVLHDWG